MAYSRLSEAAKNGTSFAMEYTTTSVDGAKTVLEIAEEIGLKIKVGYACMDQGMDQIVPGLQVSSAEAIRDTSILLDTYGPEKVFACDRFLLAVSSKTRRPLAAIAAEEGTEYETHLDETYFRPPLDAAADFSNDDFTLRTNAR